MESHDNPLRISTAGTMADLTPLASPQPQANTWRPKRSYSANWTPKSTPRTISPPWGAADKHDVELEKGSAGGGYWDSITRTAVSTPFTPNFNSSKVSSRFASKIPNFSKIPHLPFMNNRVCRAIGEVLKPEFMRPSTTGPKKLRRTAYLDGLRGFAAFLVYWGHHHLWPREAVHADKILEMGFGYHGQYYFATLPFVRIFFSGGHFAVTTFFVISGYVLAAKPLALIHAGQYLDLQENMTSALVRRYLRLHLPIVATTWLWMTIWHYPGIWTIDPHKATYAEELWNWYIEFKNFSFVFRTGGENWFVYDFHVWSIPVEFRGSLVVYTALMAFSRMTRNFRLAGEVILIYYFMYIADGWFASLFMAGVLICDLDLLAAAGNLPRFFDYFEPWKDLIFYNLFFISIWLGGVPSNSFDIQMLRDTPGWYYLSKLKPQAVFDFKWFYLFWAASFMVATIPRIAWLKSFFETRFCQYLGRISFSFYLVHGPIMWSLGDRMYAITGWYRDVHKENIPGWCDLMPLSKGGPYAMDLAWLVPHLVLLPTTLWLAEICMRLIDEPSVKFSSWLYKRTLAPRPVQTKLEQ